MIAKIPILQMGSREQSIEEITVSANVEDLFSANHAYYAYSGSFTTLPCSNPSTVCPTSDWRTSRA
jgi:carbonic anhydrase